MADVNDVIQIRHEFTVQGQACMNVFYAVIGAGSTGDLALSSFVDEYAATELLYWRDFAHEDAIFDRVVMDNLTSGLEFAEAALNAPGLQVGDGLAPVWALNVTLPRTTKITRNGSKRISGLLEQDISDGVWGLTAGKAAAIVNWCTTTQTILDYDGSGNDVFLLGRIVGRTKNIEGVYELDLSKLNAFGTPIINTVATTQRTRKA